tara:strand:+ start:42 stop:440 length:399 start_codon:yes stop_codon:yes gene_type:complete
MATRVTIEHNEGALGWDQLTIAFRTSYLRRIVKALDNKITWRWVDHAERTTLIFTGTETPAPPFDTTIAAITMTPYEVMFSIADYGDNLDDPRWAKAYDLPVTWAQVEPILIEMLDQYDMMMSGEAWYDDDD